MAIDPRLTKIMMEKNAGARRFICDQPGGFLYFCLYYFPEYFKYKIAGFQYDMHEDLVRLIDRDISFLIWMMFRESAKTTLTKLFVCYCICFNKKKYINWDSYEKENAEAALFGVATTLQTNKKIIADFGQLYWEDQKKTKRSQLKRINNFVTANGVKCEAFSTQESTRGRVFNENRPDLFVLDDFETAKTKRSAAMIRNIIEHIDELLGGLNNQASTIFLCNYISESGVVQYLLNKAKQDPKFFTRRVDAEIDGEPAWPERHTMTDIEADAINAGIDDPEKKVESLESKKRTLGDRVYGPEMLNKPEASGDLTFDREKIDAAIVAANERNKRQPPSDKGGFKTWGHFLPHHRYAIGGDTAKGVGRDSNAAVGFDFTPIPARQVSSYKNKWIAPDIFADEMKREGNFWGECLLAPEINNTGYATVTKLKSIYPIEKIYRKRQTGKQITYDDQPSDQLGWDTNTATRGTMIYEFKTAFEDGHVEVNDVELLQEMRSFNQADFENIARADDPTANVTRHFDLLIAACIGWAMRDFAEVSDKNKPQYVQAPPEAGEFEGGGTSAGTVMRPHYVTEHGADGFNKVVQQGGSVPQAPYEAGEYESPQ